MRRRTAVLSLLFVLPLFLIYAGEERFERSFSAADGGKVVVRTDFGDVTVRGSGGGSVHIVATLKGSKNEIEKFTVTAEESNGTVEVKGKARGDEWWSSIFDDLSVSFIIEVPAEFNVDITTAGGDIVMSGVSGIVGGETSGGDVRISGVGGNMKLETSGGNIVAEDVKGDMKAETSGGDISVSGAIGNIAVETSGGDITIGGVNGNVRAETSGGDIAVILAGENKGVVAETSGGDIEIITGRDIRANLDASTSGGSVVCALPITMAGEIDESRVRGTLNGGGEVITARTSGGDIRIKERAR